MVSEILIISGVLMELYQPNTNGVVLIVLGLVGAIVRIKR